MTKSAGEIQKQIEQIREEMEEHRKSADKAKVEVERTTDEAAKKAWRVAAEKEVQTIEALQRHVEELERALRQLGQ